VSFKKKILLQKTGAGRLGKHTMRKLETKIRQGLPFGKPFFAFGGIILENGAN
jgi:hypothetical protein